MHAFEKTLTTKDGMALFCRAVSVNPAKEAAIVLHGYGDHCGRLAEVVEVLTSLGVSCYLPDLRGHGRSGGKRGVIKVWDEYLDDLAVLLTEVTRWHGSHPGIIFGHSMGGLVALRYLATRPHGFGKALLSSPFVGLAFKAPAWKAALARIMSSLFPGLTLKTELNPAELCTDPAVAEDYVNDPLVHMVANARWFTEWEKAAALALAEAGSLPVGSVLLQYGTQDQIASPAAMKQLFSGLGMADKTALAYPGMRHEIFHEKDKARPMTDLAAWLKERLAA